MSSFYDDASLVVIPSGYKTSKVYSEKPTSGAGDLTFTRTGDTATRVGPDGLIEKVRTNLITHSEQFDNAAWTKSALATTITANSTVSPSGYQDADTWTINAAGARYVGQTKTVTAGAVTASFFVKKGTSDWFHLRIEDGANFAGYTYNVNTGALGQSVSSGITPTASIENYGNGWYRCIVTATVAGTSILAAGFVATSASTISGTVGASLICWGAQLETGDVMTDYIPTTTTAVSVGPVANVPRLDYLGSTCPKLLLEPQRTNLYSFSEQLNQWSAIGTPTITANYAVSPDGYQNADRVQFAAGQALFLSGTGSAGQNTLSVYAKATSGTSAGFRFFGNGATLFSSTQTATNEWQRFTFTYTYSSVTAGLAALSSGTSDVIFYGFQHEVGAYATSYIPTLSAAVTRGADACLKTGISSLIGQGSGSIFVDFNLNQLDGFGGIVEINATTFGSADRILLWENTSSQLQANFGLFGAAISTTAIVGRHKVCITYSGSFFKYFLDGAKIGESVPSVSPTGFNILSFVNDGGGVLFQKKEINQTLLFKTELSEAQAIELTTI